MNRKARRDFYKKVRNKGISKEAAYAYLEMKEAGMDELFLNPPSTFQSGDKVRIDTQKIKARKAYERMNDEYKRFIDASDGVVYTARPEKGNFVAPEENPAWHFWSGDLIKVTDTES